MANNEDSGNYRSPWGRASEEPYKKEKMPPQKSSKAWIFIVVVLFILILGVGVVYFLYFSGQEGPKVGLEFSRPSQVLAGDPFTLAVSFSNYSDSLLKNAKLSLFLPEGVYFLGQSQSQRVAEQAVGDLGPGSINQQSFNLIATGEGNTLKRIEAKLSYMSGGGSSAQFESAGQTDILIGQPAVGLNLSAPQNVFSGQDFELKVGYGNNAPHEFKNIHLKINYPPIFQFKRSTIVPDGAGNNSWNLGTIPAGATGAIVITGSVVGLPKSFFNFSGSLETDFLGNNYVLNTQSASLAISPAPLSLEITLNNSADYIAQIGDKLNYVLTYRNNSDAVMQNIAIRAKFIGELFDFTTLQSDASFNSLSNTALWLGANTPELMNLPPGGSGSVKLSVDLKNSFPIRLLSDKNYTLKAQAQIESPTVPPNTTAEKTISLADLETKVAGMLGVAAEAYWRDAASEILNAGPYPPKVNQPTQYTIHWRIANYATDVTQVRVSAFLQSGSTFTGKVKSNVESSPVYEPNSGLVVWQINFLPATKGVIGQPAEAIFQIEATPAVNQSGRPMPLLGETKIEAQDSFTGLILQASASQLDTSLPYDRTITERERNVQP